MQKILIKFFILKIANIIIFFKIYKNLDTSKEYKILSLKKLYIYIYYKIFSKNISVLLICI